MIEMPAITLWQPWASLLAHGAKKYETRSWCTSYRGAIAIHAAKLCFGPYACELPDGFREAMVDVFWPGETDWGSIEDGWDELPTGEVLATAELVGCWRVAERVDGGVWVQEVLTRERKHIVTTGNEGLFGDFTPGRYAWAFSDMKLLPQPIPATGRQRLWRWKHAES